MVEEFDLGGLGAGVPVFDGASGVEDEVVLGVGLLDEGLAGNGVEVGAAVRRGEDAVAVEGCAAPLEAVGVFDLLPGEVGVVAHASGGDALPLQKGIVGSLPTGIELVADAEAFCEGEEDVEVGAGLAGRLDGGIDLGDTPLGVGVGALLLSPDGGGQNEVGEVAGGGGVEAVLHDEKLDGAERVLEQLVVGEGDGRVGGDEPERLDTSLHCGFDDVGVGEAACGGDAVDRDVPDAREVFAILGVIEFAIAGERRGEAGLAGTHGVALAGDGEGCGAGASDVAGDEGEVVDGGDGDGALRGVVDAHGPADEGGARASVEQRGMDDLASVRPVTAATCSGVKVETNSANSAKPVVCRAM